MLELPYFNVTNAVASLPFEFATITNFISFIFKPIYFIGSISRKGSYHDYLVMSSVITAYVQQLYLLAFP